MDGQEQTAHIGRALCRWELRFFGVLQLMVIWFGHWFLRGTWPTPFKLWLSSALGVAAIADTIFWRSAGLRQIPKSTKGTLAGGYLLLFMCILLGVTAFFTWVAFGD